MFELILEIWDSNKCNKISDKTDIFLNEDNKLILKKQVSDESLFKQENTEILYGSLSLYKNNQDNVSLTDPNEFFRFLPIDRNPLVFVLAIPEEIDIITFLTIIGDYYEYLRYTRFIFEYPRGVTDPKPDDPRVMRALLYFVDQNSADNFYYDFNGRNLNTKKFEFMYLLFPSKVEFCFRDEELKSKGSSELSLKQTDSVNFLVNIANAVPISTCPICLEKIDINSSGIHTIYSPISIKVQERWISCKRTCIVCCMLLEKKDMKCNLCEEKDLWICLICGFLGCNRYKNEHAVVHYKETGHIFSMDVKNHRIWNYKEDNYVHRMIKLDTQEGSNHEECKNHSSVDDQNTQQIFIESYPQGANTNISMNSKEYLCRIENIISECDIVLASQLEEQRKYYERELQKIESSNEDNLSVLTKEVIVTEGEIEKLSKINENNKKLIKEYSKKLHAFEKQEETLISTISLNKEVISTIKNEINEAKRQEEERKEKVKEEEPESIQRKKKKIEELQNEIAKLYEEMA